MKPIFFTRRQFISKSGRAGLALATVWSTQAQMAGSPTVSLAGNAPPGGEAVRLKDLFLNPPYSARPMTRWWWFGGAATPEEITRELSLMSESGLRGVELQPVYPLEVDDPKRGIRNIRYFSPEWFDLLRHTTKETRRLGLQFDLTLGSGWPYGGPFIPIELAARQARVLIQEIAGPGSFSWRLTPELSEAEHIVAALAVPVLPTGQPDIQNSRVITDQIKRHTRYGELIGMGFDNWTVSTGLWRIMVFIDCPTGQQVKRPTLGMEGYVIDHFNRQALDLFLEAAGNQVLNELKDVADPPFRSVFCDSLEVYGADWTPSLLREFKRRRGYDLTPYLPALWQDAGPLTPHIRYDYHLTLSDLMLENFFAPLADWSQRQGMTARVQAHGAMADVMRGYALAHIPEGEHIEGGDQYAVDIQHRRLASSAGHIYQKPVISAETYTWLRLPLFLVTLEMMKAASDAQFLDGINQIVNQGYSYSPPQAGQPGWTFYASTVINHNNIWWRYYKHLAKYVQRVSALLQQGVSVNPVGVYVPLADVYAHYGIGALHMDVEIERQLGTELFLELRRSGYDFDFINDDALTRIASVQDGILRAATAAYSVVIVPDAQYMPPESLDCLLRFVQAGGFLMFAGRLPAEAPGLKDNSARTARLNSILRTFWGGNLPRVDDFVTCGKGKVLFSLHDSVVLARLPAALPPDFEIVQAGDSSESARQRARENVGFIHRRSDGVDLYFVSNISSFLQDLRAQFSVGHKVPQRWNPESGEIEDTLVFTHSARAGSPVTEVQVRLEPYESCFVVFTPTGNGPAITHTDWPGPLKIVRVEGKTEVTGLIPRNGKNFLTDAAGKTHRFEVKGIPEPISLNGPWRLTLGDKNALALTQLQSWNDWPEGKDYSGWAIYETDFELTSLGEQLEWALDLGTVHETAQVVLNGIDLGSTWKGSRILPCGKALKLGINHLRVEVGNLWIHHVQSLPKPDRKALAETFGIRWGTYGEIKPAKLPPSGLLGPVQLVPRRLWVATFEK
jgi:hypothetical protein